MIHGPRRADVGVMLCTACALLTLGESARAADPIGRFSISGRLGISGYAMGDVNDGISRSNQLIARIQPEWKVPNRIHTGFDFAGDATYDLTPNIRVGLSYGTTSGTTSVDYLQNIAIEPRATMITPRAFYRIPFRPLINMALRAFGGVVLLQGVETKIEHEDTSETGGRIESMTIDGSGAGAVAGILAEYTLADRFSLAFEGGYRIAKAGFDSGDWRITELEDPGSDDDGDGIPNDRDLRPESYLWGFLDKTYEQVSDVNLPEVREDLDADFSGFTAQLGLRIYIF